MLVDEKYELITHNGRNGNIKVHAIADTISEAIQFYYDYRKHFGYMEVVGQKTRNTFATLGSR